MFGGKFHVLFAFEAHIGCYTRLAKCMIYINSKTLS